MERHGDIEVLIGVHETEAAAVAAIERVKNKPGFIDSSWVALYFGNCPLRVCNFAEAVHGKPTESTRTEG